MAAERYTPRSKSGKHSQKPDPLLLSRDATWLSSLSEPELDFLISLKELAIMRSKTAGHRALAGKFDLSMLRSLGVILLEHFKDTLKGIPSHGIDVDLIDKLPLLSSSTPDTVNLETPTSNFATLKRKHMHDGSSDVAGQSSKKQKTTVKEESVEY